MAITILARMQRSLNTASSETAAEWWGARRRQYNLALLAAGAIAFVCYVGVVWTRCADVAGVEVSAFTTLFQGIGYLFAVGLANIFYYLGPGVERLVAPAHRAKYRRWAFRAGLVFSVALPFIIPLIVLVNGCSPGSEP